MAQSQDRGGPGPAEERSHDAARSGDDRVPADDARVPADHVPADRSTDQPSDEPSEQSSGRPPQGPEGGDAAATRESAGIRTMFSAERAKAYVDAVVAIAMTLLILPLMESVGDAAAESMTAGEWFGEHSSQLISFVLSFCVIAMFWIRHHQLFADVEAVTNRLLWIMALWMLTIVWLPVSTAMSGQMATEPVVQSVYIGSMIATALCTLLTRAYLHAHPELHETPQATLRRGMLVDLSMALLFAVALLIAVLVPAIGYFALFLLMLVGVVSRLLRRLPIGR